LKWPLPEGTDRYRFLYRTVARPLLVSIEFHLNEKIKKVGFTTKSTRGTKKEWHIPFVLFCAFCGES
jgi:hypothetical protein